MAKLKVIPGKGNGRDREARRERFEELARRLSCAAVSYQMGLSYQTCMKRYVKDLELGEYWYELAEQVAREMAERAPLI